MNGARNKRWRKEGIVETEKSFPKIRYWYSLLRTSKKFSLLKPLNPLKGTCALLSLQG